jgi:hypothetical protein
MDHPFVELVDLIERAVDLARENYHAHSSGTENGMIAWVVTQELRRSGYRISSPTGFSYPDDMRSDGG